MLSKLSNLFNRLMETTKTMLVDLQKEEIINDEVKGEFPLSLGRAGIVDKQNNP